MAYTNVWTTGAPLDTQAANQGAVDFRATKLDVMQRISSFGAGLLANRPTPEATSGTADWTGVMYWATDTSQVFRWNGTSWDDISLDIPSGNGIATALATTGAPVNVSLAAPPTVGQIPIATDATHATWQTPIFIDPTTLAAALAAIVPATASYTGSGAGIYTSVSTALVPVDAVNLESVVTIPVGWKLLIFSSGTFYLTDQNWSYFVALVDGSTVLTQRYVTKADESPSGRIESLPWSLSAAVTGDGEAHTISLQFGTFNPASAVRIQNTTGEDIPTLLFFVTPSN
jgi:hypothetical protein